MTKLSYNSNGLRNLPLADAIRAVANAGYDGMELSLHESHLHPFGADGNALGEIDAAFKQEDILPVCLATGANNLLSPRPFEPSLISPSPEDRKARIALIRRSIEIAKQLSIPVVNFASGIRSEAVSRGEARCFLIEGIEACLDGIGDLVLAIEPEPGFFIETTTDALTLIRQIDSQNFRLNLDIGHVFCCEPEGLSAIEHALPFTRHIHIEDIKDNIHHHEIPGEGNLDLCSILSMLDQAGYAHFASVELYDHADCWERAITTSRANLLKMMGN